VRFRRDPFGDWPADGSLADAGVLIHCTDGYEDHHAWWRPPPGMERISSSLVFAADEVPGFAIPLFTCKKGGVVFRPRHTRLVCGNAGDSGGGCGAFSCPRAMDIGNLRSYQAPGDGCNGGSWRPPDFGMYLRRMSLWHKLNSRLGYNEIIVDAAHWRRTQPELVVETFFIVKGQEEGHGEVRAMHETFLRETGRSSTEAPLLMVDPDDWTEPFS
tara:strand:+ start:2067 stop:2711 length:645 start_codon:yes stop_codon:yes gene_type:complete